MNLLIESVEQTIELSNEAGEHSWIHVDKSVSAVSVVNALVTTATGSYGLVVGKMWAGHHLARDRATLSAVVHGADQEFSQSPLSDLNRRPSLYKSGALPLS